MLSTTPTRFDLKFFLFGIPVRVHPAFWIVGLLLGYQKGDLRLTFIWLVVLFVSILVHEMGHALTARKFGWPPNILLYHFGGLAMFQPTFGWSRKRSILISLAGPGAGFLLYGLTLGVEEYLSSAARDGQEWAARLLINEVSINGTSINEVGLSEIDLSEVNRQDISVRYSGVKFAITQLKWINLWWGVFNLLPVFPLDGGTSLLRATQRRQQSERP